MKPTMLQLSLASHFLAAGLLCACASASDGVSAPPSAAPSTVALLPGAQSALGHGAVLQFDAIADSRCPPNVQCISAGKLAYRFTLRGGAAPETFLLDPSAPRHDSAQIKGISVELNPTAAPIAAGTAAAPPTQRPVTLTIHTSLPP